MIHKPDPHFVPAYYNYYIGLIEEIDLIQALEKNLEHTEALFRSIAEPDSLFRYAEGKWTIRGVMQHIIECERIFAYRALRYSRFDETPLPGYDENSFGEHAVHLKGSWEDLFQEFKKVRHSTRALYKQFTDEMLDFKGTASGYTTSARALGFLIVGHCKHHSNVIHERYISALNG